MAIRLTNLPRRWAIAVGVVLCGVCGNAAATLFDRGPDLLYDDVLNVTWARDAGLAGGPMTWDQASAWVQSLTLGGFDDWRLPKISVSGGNAPLNASTTIAVACSVLDEAACRDDELAYMFYFNLFPAFVQTDRTGDQISFSGQVIKHIQQVYWSDTGLNPTDAWAVTFGGLTNPCQTGCGGGWYVLDPKNLPFFAWAVRDGDVRSTTVPEPATIALVAIGVSALGLRRRRRANEQRRS